MRSRQMMPMRKAHRRDLEIAVEAGDGLLADQGYRLGVALGEVRCQMRSVRS